MCFIERKEFKIYFLLFFVTSFNGVERVFAIQAGREVRVMVKPDDLNDIEAATLARNIVKKVEEDLVFPGQIKVTVIRETRNVEYAK